MIVDPDSLKEKEIDLLSSSAIVTNSEVTKNILILLKYEYHPPCILYVIILPLQEVKLWQCMRSDFT